jgi:hypothetical protein
MHVGVSRRGRGTGLASIIVCGLRRPTVPRVGSDSVMFNLSSCEPRWQGHHIRNYELN